MRQLHILIKNLRGGKNRKEIETAIGEFLESSVVKMFMKKVFHSVGNFLKSFAKFIMNIGAKKSLLKK